MKSEKETEKKPLPMNETMYIGEGIASSLFSNPGRELKVFNQLDDALKYELEDKTVRVGIYKLERIICIKKVISTVQVSCEGAK